MRRFLLKVTAGVGAFLVGIYLSPAGAYPPEWEEIKLGTTYEQLSELIGPGDSIREEEVAGSRVLHRERKTFLYTDRLTLGVQHDKGVQLLYQIRPFANGTYIKHREEQVKVDPPPSYLIADEELD